MKKLITIMLLAVSIVPLMAFSAEPPLDSRQQRQVAQVRGIRVEYQTQDGKHFTLYGNQERSVIEKGSEGRIFVDYQDGKYYNLSAKMGDLNFITTNPISEIELGEAAGTDTMFTWGCQIYEFEHNSASYKVWVTNELGFRGSYNPSLILPLDGIVLRVEKNGICIVEATKLDRTISTLPILELSIGDFLNLEL